MTTCSGRCYTNILQQSARSIRYHNKFDVQSMELQKEKFKEECHIEHINQKGQ